VDGAARREHDQKRCNTTTHFGPGRAISVPFDAAAAAKVMRRAVTGSEDIAAPGARRPRVLMLRRPRSISRLHELQREPIRLADLGVSLPLLRRRGEIRR